MKAWYDLVQFENPVKMSFSGAVQNSAQPNNFRAFRHVTIGYREASLRPAWGNKTTYTPKEDVGNCFRVQLRLFIGVVHLPQPPPPGRSSKIMGIVECQFLENHQVLNSTMDLNI